jgi:hypothetical protein
LHGGLLARPWAQPTEFEVRIFTGYGRVNAIVPAALANLTTRTMALQRRIEVNLSEGSLVVDCPIGVRFQEPVARRLECCQPKSSALAFGVAPLPAAQTGPRKSAA